MSITYLIGSDYDTWLVYSETGELIATADNEQTAIRLAWDHYFSWWPS